VKKQAKCIHGGDRKGLGIVRKGIEREKNKPTKGGGKERPVWKVPFNGAPRVGNITPPCKMSEADTCIRFYCGQMGH